jgi:hypothetical protein
MDIQKHGWFNNPRCIDLFLEYLNDSLINKLPDSDTFEEITDPNQLSLLDTEASIQEEGVIVEKTTEESAEILKEAIKVYKENEKEEEQENVDLEAELPDEEEKDIFDLEDLDFEDENVDLSGL